MLNIEQKKGNRDSLSGRLIAYAFVDQEEGFSQENSPFSGMVQSGILAVSGDYNEQLNLKDFLKKEFGSSMDGDISGLIEQLGGLNESPGDEFNVDEVKKKMKDMAGMDMMPVPAKIEFFASEADILARDADIFFLGKFDNQANAHLAVTSFPILYQSFFREQQNKQLELEISSLLEEVESGTTIQKSIDTNENAQILTLELNGSIESYKGNLDKLLVNKIIPVLIHSMDYDKEFNINLERFSMFMQGFAYPQELNRLFNELILYRNHNSTDINKLELFCKKISALHHEEYDKLKSIQEKIDQLS